MFCACLKKKYHLTKQPMSLRDCCWGCFHRSSSTPALYFYTWLQPFSLHPTDANQPDMKGDRLIAAAILMKTPRLCTNHLFHCTPRWVIYPKKGLYPYVQADLTLAPGKSHCCTKEKLTHLSGYVGFRYFCLCQEYVKGRPMIFFIKSFILLVGKIKPILCDLLRFLDL